MADLNVPKNKLVIEMSRLINLVGYLILGHLPFMQYCISLEMFLTSFQLISYVYIHNAVLEKYMKVISM